MCTFMNKYALLRFNTVRFFVVTFAQVRKNGRGYNESGRGLKFRLLAILALCAEKSQLMPSNLIMVRYS